MLPARCPAVSVFVIFPRSCARNAHRSTRPPASRRAITIDGLAPGAYTIDVTGADPASPFTPVSSDILIWVNPMPGTSTG